MYNKIIHSEKELKWFYDNVMPDLLPAETYFLSLSARAKYLTKEEREAVSFGRNEMFARTIIRKKDWNTLVRSLRKLECDERGYTTKGNTPIPSKTLVCYFNINPSNSIKALVSFQKLLGDYFEEMSLLAIGSNKSETAFLNRLSKIQGNLTTCYQTATGTKHWIDFDFDVTKNEEFRLAFSQYLNSLSFSKYVWVDTKSGYHLLIRKNQLKMNPAILTKEACRLADTFGLESKEIIQNRNMMVPLPGTFAGGHKVVVLNKEDFV